MRADGSGLLKVEGGSFDSPQLARGNEAGVHGSELSGVDRQLVL